MITITVNNIYYNVTCQVWKIRKRQFIMIFKNNFVLILSIALLTAFNSIVSFANEGGSMTEHKTKSNRLINEKSPYLLQHANNPVDWYPWGPEALERARREDKPILLSIGYSTCHWCHVMEEESFTNPQIAELMNANFICIKVDREERPDLDRIYMTAVTAIAGSGGWPLNVFLTPDLKPFYGGTYFPLEARPGMMTWPDLLRLITRAWHDPVQRQKFLSYSLDLNKKIADYLSWHSKDALVDITILDKAMDKFVSRFNTDFGGFSEAPKFPSPSIQNFLFAYNYYVNHGNNKTQYDNKALEMSTFTLDAMAKGGVYDQLGGGFHRYSTDAKWHVPHFEKMLYDNAQLIINYLDAYLVTKNRFFKKIAEESLDYVLRDMTSTEGGFYSAEDADSLPAENKHKMKKEEKVEGAFYVWTEKEINDLLGSKTGKIFSYRYGVKPQGNAEYDPFGEFKGKNILFIDHSMDQVVKRFGISEKEAIKILEVSKLKLLATRTKRPRPHLDDKILTSWNGLMISAMSKAYQVLGEKKYLKAAGNAADFIQKNLYDMESMQLFRRWREGERKIPGMADDYAFLTQGLIDLYESDFDFRWLERALKLTDEQIKLFYDKENSGFFMTRKGHDKNINIRIKEDTDSVIPSASSVAVLNLLRLSRFTDSKEYISIAEKTMRSVLARINQSPDQAAQLLVSMIFSLAKPVEIMIAGEKNNENTSLMLQKVYDRYIQGRIVILVNNGDTRQKLVGLLPFISSVKRVSKKTTAYICTNRTCNTPVTDPEAIDRLLN